MTARQSQHGSDIFQRERHPTRQALIYDTPRSLLQQGVIWEVSGQIYTSPLRWNDRVISEGGELGLSHPSSARHQASCRSL